MSENHKWDEDSWPIEQFYDYFLVLYCIFSDKVDVVSVLAGDTGHIPCDINTQSGSEDRLKLVLWFRNMSDTPFYT